MRGIEVDFHKYQAIFILKESTCFAYDFLTLFHCSSLISAKSFTSTNNCVKMPIKSIKARQIYDSRGNPTVEVTS